MNRWRIFALLIAVILVLFGAIAPALANAPVYTDPDEFAAATAELGPPVIVDFNEIDARPINNTIEGRDPFPGNHYAAQGITLFNPDYALFIAPEGLFWNSSNSLSVWRFPFDPLEPCIDDDDLLITLDPPCVAVGFTLVDNGSCHDSEYIQFIDATGNVVAQAGFPPNFTSYRAFIGIISLDQPIATINILEDSADGDDVNYDEFILFPQSTAISAYVDVKPQSCPNPFNMEAQGVLPVAVLGTESFDASQIDPASVRLVGVEPLRWAWEDVATPFVPPPDDAGGPKCTDEGPDGFLDLTLKFDHQAIAQALGGRPIGPGKDREELFLALSGNLREEYGGAAIEGGDFVIIIRKGGPPAPRPLPRAKGVER